MVPRSRHPQKKTSGAPGHEPPPLFGRGPGLRTQGSGFLGFRVQVFGLGVLGLRLERLGLGGFFSLRPFCVSLGSFERSSTLMWLVAIHQEGFFLEDLGLDSRLLNGAALHIPKPCLRNPKPTFPQLLTLNALNGFLSNLLPKKKLSEFSW